MKKNSLKLIKEYLLKLNHQYIRSKVDNVNYVVNINDTSSENDKTYSYDIAINQIADVNIILTNNIAFDLFNKNHELGSFLLIDKDDNSTICAGIITGEIAPKRKLAKEEFLNELSGLVNISVKKWIFLYRISCKIFLLTLFIFYINIY